MGFDFYLTFIWPKLFILKRVNNVTGDVSALFYNDTTFFVFLLCLISCFSLLTGVNAANNSGVNKRQITDLVDQSIQINTHCFVVTADNRYILVCGFWDKSFRVYSTETGRC